MVNTAVKGRRNEHRVIAILKSQGYTCTRAAASKGVFDIIAFNKLGSKHVQVKTNGWPSPAERKTMLDMKNKLPDNATIEAWRFNDGDTSPVIKNIEDF